MLHLFLSFLGRVLYGLRVYGRDRLPATGPVLLVSNHVTYIDGLLLLAASPRHVRFLITAEFFRVPVVGWALRTIRAVPMERGGGPKALKRSLDTIAAVLAAGDVVCIFPEGFPTRAGPMLPFRRGFERVARQTGAAVVPVWLDQLWGSRFSYFGGAMFWKRSHRPRYPVSVTFGPPLPAEVSAADARQALVELSAEAAKRRVRDVYPAHRSFLRMAARHPFRPCLYDPHGAVPEMNYGKAAAGALCLADWLRPQLGDDAMVGLWLPSAVGAVLANLAVNFLGKTAVNLNYTAGTANVQSAVRQCGIRHVLTSKRFLARVPLDPGDGVQVIALEDAAPQITWWQRVHAFLHVVIQPAWLLEIAVGTRKHKADDVATVVFSSGSTGEPKGIVLTHGNIAANVESFLEHAEFTPRDRVLGVLPFFHSFGYTVTFWGPLLAGAASVYHPDPRAAKEVGELSRKYGATLMGSTATFLRFYLRKCDPADFKTMRLVVCGAEKLPPELIAEFQAKFGVEPKEGYGCTELSPVVSANMPDMAVVAVKQVRTKVGSVGQPLPGVAPRIVHPETGQPLPIGEEGLLLVTGPNVMTGYLGRPDLTAAKLRDGWYDTGDVGKLDADGFITLTGRLSRFAKIGGEMVPLERVEDELHKVLGTTDRALALVALPDPKKGERMLVLHLPLPEGWDVRKLVDGLSKTGLPNLWQPGERDFVAVKELPLLGSGKLDLQRLKGLAQEVVSGRGG